jgi:hypothetical protein
MRGLPYVTKSTLDLRLQSNNILQAQKQSKLLVRSLRAKLADGDGQEALKVQFQVFGTQKRATTVSSFQLCSSQAVAFVLVLVA